MSGRARVLAALPAVVFAACALAAGGLAGCAGPDAAAGPDDPGGAPVVPGTPGGDTGVGSFSMQLTVGGGIRFDQVSYDVSGNGFHKAGTIDVAASNVISTVVGGVPFGSGYVLQLTTQDVDRKLTPCTGMATFDIPGAATVPVPVRLICHELAAPTAQAVPVPRWSTLMVAALLLTLGMHAVRRRRRV